MGELAVPNRKDRERAALVARDLLDKISRDEAIEPSYFDVWLIASTLAWCNRQRATPNMDRLAEKMFDAAELDRFHKGGEVVRRWSALGQEARDGWVAAARVAHREIMRERP